MPGCSIWRATASSWSSRTRSAIGRCGTTLRAWIRCSTRGACLLLDACSVVGKYGRAPQRAAERLLDDGAYQAACSDAHRPEDVGDLDRALQRLDTLVGRTELERLFDEGPRQILGGKPG
jgi:hypothetical protein